jgi:hypothetical protein
MATSPPKIDWLGFWIQFALGALFGAVLGGVFWSKILIGYAEYKMVGALCIGGGFLLGGLVAGFGKDGFWASLKESRWGKF